MLQRAVEEVQPRAFLQTRIEKTTSSRRINCFCVERIWGQHLLGIVQLSGGQSVCKQQIVGEGRTRSTASQLVRG